MGARKRAVPKSAEKESHSVAADKKSDKRDYVPSGEPRSSRKRQVSQKMQEWLEEQECKKKKRQSVSSPKKISKPSNDRSEPYQEQLDNNQVIQKNISPEENLSKLAESYCADAEEVSETVIHSDVEVENSHSVGDQITSEEFSEPIVEQSVETITEEPGEAIVMTTIVPESDFTAEQDGPILSDMTLHQEVDVTSHAVNNEIEFSEHQIIYSIPDTEYGQATPSAHHVQVTPEEQQSLPVTDSVELLSTDEQAVTDEVMSVVYVDSVSSTKLSDMPQMTVKQRIVSDIEGHHKYKLAEEIRIDESGREQHVIFLTTTDQAASACSASPLTASPAKLPFEQTQINTVQGQALVNPTIKAKIIRPDAPKMISKNVYTVTSGGQLQQQEVVLEVLVDTMQGSEKNTNEAEDNTMEVKCEVIDGREVYGCSICEYKTEGLDDLKKHVRRHDDRPHKCPECDHKARTLSNLKRHILSHTNERKFQCPHCTLKFKQKIHMDKHINYIHKEKSVRCPYCDYTCANAVPDLKLHMKRKHLKQHPDDPPTYLECQKCGFLCASKKDLKQHSKFHKAGPELKLFCELCSFVTDAKSRLDRHMMIHSKEKPYACPQCDYKASQKEHIKRHLRTRHNVEDSEKILPSTETNDSLVADQESQQSNNESSVQNKSVLDEASMEAPAEQFSSSVSYSDDQQIAEDSCQSSEYIQVIETSTDTTEGRLNKPVKYEPPDYSEKTKIFACTHCTMKFVRLLSLYKHLYNQHADRMPRTEEDRLTCVICDFKAPSHKALLVHMRKHNNQDDDSDEGMLYMCVLCKYVNAKRRNLYQHLKKKHKISIIVKKDGTASCIVEPNADVTVVASNEDDENVEVVSVNATASAGESSKVVNIIDLANSLTQKHGITGFIQKVEGDHTEQVAAEAIVDLATQSINHEEVMTAVIEGDDCGQKQVQLSAQQLHQLSSGDIIEINGETYKVEFHDESITAVPYESDQTEGDSSAAVTVPVDGDSVSSIIMDTLTHSSDDIVIENVQTNQAVSYAVISSEDTPNR